MGALTQFKRTQHFPQRPLPFAVSHRSTVGVAPHLRLQAVSGAAKLDIFGLVDHTQPAAAQLLHDAVVRNRVRPTMRKDAMAEV